MCGYQRDDEGARQRIMETMRQEKGKKREGTGKGEYKGEGAEFEED